MCIACSVYRNSSILLDKSKMKLFSLYACFFCAFIFIIKQSVLYFPFFYLTTPFLMLYGTVGHSLFINDLTYTLYFFWWLKMWAASVALYKSIFKRLVPLFFCLHPFDGSKMLNIPSLRTSWVCSFRHPAEGWSIYSLEAMEQMIHVPHASRHKTKCILCTHQFKNLSTACCTSANSLTYAELAKDCNYINAPS